MTKTIEQEAPTLDAAQARRDAHATAWETLITDIGDRRSQAEARLTKLQQAHNLKLQAVRATGEFFDYDKSMALQKEAGDLYQEIRTLQHLTLPGLDRERELMTSGGHPVLGAHTHVAAINAANRAREDYLQAMRDFRKALSPEVIAIAQRVLDTSTAMLITAPECVRLVADWH
jgi:hypothetical protein